MSPGHHEAATTRARAAALLGGMIEDCWLQEPRNCEHIMGLGHHEAATTRADTAALLGYLCGYVCACVCVSSLEVDSIWAAVCMCLNMCVYEYVYMFSMHGSWESRLRERESTHTRPAPGTCSRFRFNDYRNRTKNMACFGLPQRAQEETAWTAFETD